MGFPLTRASREYKFVRSTGSSILVKQYTQAGVLVEPGILFDVELGVLTDIYFNDDVTNSGGAGETQRERVGLDWSYALSLSFPAALLGSSLALAFVQGLVGSVESVWMRFFIGDRDFWELRAVPLLYRSFLGRKSLLTSVVQRFDSKGKKVVGLNVAGEGNSLLVGELDGKQVWP
jgi:hypothetical protein